ncbi:hypothetical protein H4R18_004634 [Coemansia javaensis]|uniref:Hydrophobin n=1 Tax=Coemansia javaensis TaxID=2761396 RepID=A0A9W8H794_9FUNG|nr:hypothetical protein H4R18_004634 [Coemansia javaensis]
MRLPAAAAVFTLASFVAASPAVIRRDDSYQVSTSIPPYPGTGEPTPGTCPCAPNPTDVLQKCGFTGERIALLSPLLQALGLAQTVDGVKQLIKKVVIEVGGLVGGPVGDLLNGVTNLVSNILGVQLPIDNLVQVIVHILTTDVPCILDALLPLP